MRKKLFFILLIFSAQRLSAQEYKYLIHFKDKKNNGFSLSNPNLFLSEKSIHRRVSQGIAIDSTDLPLTQAYIDSLSLVPTVKIFNTSKWFNQILISVTDTNYLSVILHFSFVLTFKPVNNQNFNKIPGHVSLDQQFVHAETSSLNVHTGVNFSETDQLNYGASVNQIHIHHGEFLHNMGFHGEGMTIAILDDGFNSYLSNPAFETIRESYRVLGTYDYVNQKISVNEEDIHGSNCFSTLASNIPGTMIGTAPGASFWLFKTEDVNSETPVEEQNWIAAAEYADSAGADLITTSLGYSYFDNPAYNINYAERDGHSSMISQAANLCVAKGMIVTASAGNSGEDLTETRYVICPADGDSVYAVGAVSADSIIAGFSSWGPNASGQVKPDGVSVGEGAVLVSPSGDPVTGNGTSYSNPILAGLISCLWQAFPEFPAHSILDAVRQSSNRFNNPDAHYGYGLPDFQKAYNILQNKRLNGIAPLQGNEWFSAFPVPFHGSISVLLKPSYTGNGSLQLLDVRGKVLLKQTVYTTSGQLLLIELNVNPSLSTGVYFIRYADPKESKTLKMLKW